MVWKATQGILMSSFMVSPWLKTVLQTRLVHLQAQLGPQWGFWESRKANYNVKSHLPSQISILSPQPSHHSSKGIRHDYAGVRERKTGLELFWDIQNIKIILKTQQQEKNWI